MSANQNAVAGSVSMPQPVADWLAEHPSPWVRVAAIGRCSRPVLDLLAHDSDPFVRVHVGHHFHLSVGQCELLAADPNERVRWAVAGNRAAPPLSVLDALSRDTSTRVRKAVAGNPLITTDLACRLLTDPHTYVRKALAGNTSAPGEVLTALARPRSRVSIRHAVAGNPVCPPTLRARLATRDRSPYVRAIAAALANKG